ncbi:hypothetical protein PO909_009750 [Leuciscus waleckii]
MSATGASSNPRRGQPPKKIAPVTVVVCGSRRLALRLTAITSPSSGSIVAGRSRWCCSSSEGVEGGERLCFYGNNNLENAHWSAFLARFKLLEIDRLIGAKANEQCRGSGDVKQLTYKS